MSSIDRTARGRGRDRAVVPVVGVIGLVAVTVVLTAALGASALGTTVSTTENEVVTASLELDVREDTLVFAHRGGDELDVRELQVHVSVAGESLEHQPSVPFFAHRGFSGGPGGPFNTATSSHWHPGERTSIQIADTNDPTPQPGDRVRVRIFVDDRPIADLTDRR